MALTSIPVKTPEGQAELSQRSRRLSQRQRTVLFLVDGKRTVVEVQTLALQAGAPPSCMDELFALGLIVVTQPTVPMARFTAGGSHRAESPDIWLESGLAPALPRDDAVPGASPSADSELHPARTLAPDSLDGNLLDAPSPKSEFQGSNDGEAHAALEEARRILLHAVRLEAPLAGSLTLLRLRRARSGEALRALLDEVEMRISKPQHALAAQETLRRVRQLLSYEPKPEPPKF